MVRIRRVPVLVERARRNTKAGWKTLSGQVPPDLFERLAAKRVKRGRSWTDLVYDALAFYDEHGRAA